MMVARARGYCQAPAMNVTPKYPEYVIAAVCRSEATRRIVEVKAQPSIPATTSQTSVVLDEVQILNRQEVVFWLGLGTKFYSSRRVGKVVFRGAPIETVAVKGETFLRTSADEIAEDNLGDMPEYDCAAAKGEQ